MANEKFNNGMGNIYYEVSGSDEKNGTLVLSHAAFLDSGMWDSQWDAFAQQYRVVRYDALGHGKSDKVTAPRARRDELYALLQHLGIQKAHLLGCSMGGQLTLDLVLEHPEVAQSMILVNSDMSGYEPQGAPPQELLDMMEASQKGDVERTSELQMRIWIDGPHRTADQIDPNVRKRAAEMNRIFINNQTWQWDMQPHKPLTPPAIARLNEVHVPTLVVIGALDYDITLEVGELLTAGIPNAKKVTIPNTAHTPNMEKPEEFNRIVLDFLGGVR